MTPAASELGSRTRSASFVRLYSRLSVCLAPGRPGDRRRKGGSKAGQRWRRAALARRGAVVDIHVAMTVYAHIDAAAAAAIGATLTRVESSLLSLVLPLPVENVDLVPMV
jgi:hypothetical protein